MSQIYSELKAEISTIESELNQQKEEVRQKGDIPMEEKIM